MWLHVPDASYVITGCVGDSVSLIIWVVWESYFINMMRGNCLIQKKHEAAHLVPRSLFWGFILRLISFTDDISALVCRLKKPKKHINIFLKIYDCYTSAQWHLFHFEVCKAATFRAGCNQLACWESSTSTSIEHRQLHLLTKHRLIFVFKPPHPKKARFCGNLSYIKRGGRFAIPAWFFFLRINFVVLLQTLQLQ